MNEVETNSDSTMFQSKSDKMVTKYNFESQAAIKALNSFEFVLKLPAVSVCGFQHTLRY